MTQKTGAPASSGTIARSSALAACRATGKATVACKDAVLAAYKGGAWVVTRTSGALASSVAFLNPFRTRARPCKRAKLQWFHPTSAAPASLPIPAPPTRNSPHRVAPAHSPQKRARELALPQDAPPTVEAGPAVPEPSGAAVTEGNVSPAGSGTPPLRESGAAEPDTAQAEVEPMAGEQADAARVIRELEEQVVRLTDEKRALEGRLADGEAALADIRIAVAQLAMRKEELPEEESADLEEGDEVPSEHAEAEAKQEQGATQPEADTVPAAEPRGLQPAMAGSGTLVPEIVPQEAQPTAAGGTPEPEQEDAQGAEREQAREEEFVEDDTGVADGPAGALEPAAPQELPPDESVLPQGREEEPTALEEAKEEETRQEPIAAPPDDGAAPAVEARERPSATLQVTTSVPDVTPIEVHAATFSGAAEKVTFRRALSDMESSDEATRLEAVKTVGGICHELSVRALAVCFSREASARAREECVNALVRLGLRECLPTVERALADAAAPVRLAAVRGMYRLAGRGGADALTRVLRDENEDVRRRAATCIGWLGEDRLARELVPLLADKSAAVRCAALEAMGNLRSQQAVAEVMELLGDPRDSVRRKAADVLCVLTGKQMTSTVPDDEDSRQRLITRWRAWWAAEPRVAGAE